MSGLVVGDISCAELEYYAENTTIKIIPKVDHPAFYFISVRRSHDRTNHEFSRDFHQGQYGPLETDIEISVPLWLAITLRKRDRCVIVCPEWLTVAALRASIAEDKVSDKFSKLPYYYAEIANLLFTQ